MSASVQVELSSGVGQNMRLEQIYREARGPRSWNSVAAALRDPSRISRRCQGVPHLEILMWSVCVREGEGGSRHTRRCG
ncbi:uncharacterized [Tachysurus ichikawai]